MEAPVISSEVLARYAGDAALEVNGVSGLTRGAAEVTRTGRSAISPASIDTAINTDCAKAGGAPEAWR